MTNDITAEQASAAAATVALDSASDATPEAEPAAPVLFRDLALPNEILRAVDDLGFSQCTPIQGRVRCHP